MDFHIGLRGKYPQNSKLFKNIPQNSLTSFTGFAPLNEKIWPFYKKICIII